MRGSGGRWGDRVVMVGPERVGGASAGWLAERAAGARGGVPCGVAGCVAARRVRVRGGGADGSMERSGAAWGGCSVGVGWARVHRGRQRGMVGFRPPYGGGEAARAAAMAWCHATPVRHGFAAHPRDWSFSTVYRWKPATAFGETLGQQPGTIEQD